jgi:alkylhydroperoxidase family enzyme
MSTLYLTEKRCYHCNAQGKFPQIDPYITIVGPKDLDGRPAHIQRSSVYLWIQRCNSCGYCAQDISSGEKSEKDIIESNEYRSQLFDVNYPETANSFLAHTYFMKREDLLADAGWDTVFAAWICDDNGFEEGARNCRIMAIEFFSEAKKRGQQFAPTSIEENIYLIDIYRRCNLFNEALDLCNLELKQEYLDEKYLNLLLYEKELIEKSDILCHNDIEAEEFDT